MPWALTRMGVSIIRDIIVALVAAIAGAILGLGEWQRQFNAKNEHELARRIILSGLSHYRMPLITISGILSL